MLIPLHAKTHYSLGRGTASPQRLVERAAALGLPALALTDVETLSAQPRFHDLCQRHGLQAITGVELTTDAPPGERNERPRVQQLAGRALRDTAGEHEARILLLARNAAGYRSLCRIVSRRHSGAGSEAEQAAARDAVAAVAAHSEGLFVMTDNARTLGRLIEQPSIDPASLRVLLVRPASSAQQEAALRAAVEHRVPVVADAEAALADPDEQPLHALLTAILMNRRICERELAPVDHDTAASALRWLRAPADATALFADVPEAIAEANRVAEQCAFRLRRRDVVAPGAEAFDGALPAAELARRCEAALRDARAHGRCAGGRYDRRSADELETIDRLGYSGYLLAAAEIAAAARDRRILAAPRGSAIGSLVVHLLGISTIDPVAHELCFERFLHVERDSPPDIDLDVCSARRDELIRWTYRRFGRQRVAVVGAHHTYGVASAVRYGLKAIGSSPAQIERFAAELARRGIADDAVGADEQLWRSDLFSPYQPHTSRTMLRLVGKPRQLALHPGGLVIAPDAIDDHVPVERAMRGLTVTQYDLRSIDSTGLTKLDVLGNRFLSQLKETLELAKRGSPDSVVRRLEDIPLDDAETLARIDRADTIGCFQVETPPLRALLTQLPIARLEDCVAALALVRPGAAAGRVKRAYVRRARGMRYARAAHDEIAAPLGATHGLLLYDEDLMRVLAEVAGISLGAADRMRTAIIDADTEQLRELERAFARFAAEQGRSAALSSAAWSNVARFAAYSFCKAHAWSYALMAYQSAYLKHHHPIEFGCALLNYYGGAYPLRTIAADLTRSGVDVLAPSVNHSSALSTLERDREGRDVIRVGLLRVKHMSRRNVDAIVEQCGLRGPFASVADLLQRVQLSQRELRALVLSGACDELAPLSPDAYPFAHEALLRERPGAVSTMTRSEPVARAPLAPAALADGAADRPSRTKVDDEAERLATYRTLVRIRNELELLSMHLTAHPLDVLRPEARRYGCSTSAEIRAMARSATAIRFAGILAASRRHRTSERRAPTFFLTLEDEHGLLEAVIPPHRYAELAPRVTTPGPYLVEGRVADDYGHVSLVISALLPFHERMAAWREDGADSRTA